MTHIFNLGPGPAGPEFAELPLGKATMAPDMPGAVNYYRWIVAQLVSHLGRHVLDIGGGYGAHLEFILPQCPNVVSIDLSEECVRFMRGRFESYGGFSARWADFSREETRLALGQEHFDSIVCLNVLEHIEDDLAAVRGMASILEATAGKLLLQVPAHPWLYGSLDAQAGHYRRYTVESLAQLLRAAGFEIVTLYYFNSLGVLPWFINSRVLRTKIESGNVSLQIKIFDRYLVPVLQAVEDRVKPPLGQSLIAVARVRTKQ